QSCKLVRIGAQRGDELGERAYSLLLRNAGVLWAQARDDHDVALEKQVGDGAAEPLADDVGVAPRRRRRRLLGTRRRRLGIAGHEFELAPAEVLRWPGREHQAATELQHAQHL